MKNEDILEKEKKYLENKEGMNEQRDLKAYMLRIIDNVYDKAFSSENIPNISCIILTDLLIQNIAFAEHDQLLIDFLRILQKIIGTKRIGIFRKSLE